ncbi:MAG: DNA-processing protein DprA [Patescibacteria group bacterium]
MLSQILQFNDFPILLREIYQPPHQLFYKGNLEALNRPCISIVGTRKNSDYGEEMTRKIVKELAVYDLNIVSGLAKGIDTIAHQSALENGLNTIAVLGGGIENIYPYENIGLAEEILQKGGLILSEFEALAEPTRYTFPQRNRIVSGLSLVTIVVEAPEKSGALITADLALNQGREVMVVPADVDRPSSTGILKLLQKGGAYPIATGKEVIERLNESATLFSKKSLSALIKPNKKEIPTYKLTDQENKIFTLLQKHRTKNIEIIYEQTKLPITNILTTLSFLEIKGLVKNVNGQYKKA